MMVFGSIDLNTLILFQRIEILKGTYESIDDIELMAGIWLERPIGGGFVPPTFYCLVVDQFMRNIVSDRHWYERPIRPNAFTLGEIINTISLRIFRAGRL